MYGIVGHIIIASKRKLKEKIVSHTNSIYDWNWEITQTNEFESSTKIELKKVSIIIYNWRAEDSKEL